MWCGHAQVQYRQERSGTKVLDSEHEDQNEKNIENFFVSSEEKRIYSYLNYRRNKEKQIYLFLNYQRTEDKPKYLFPSKE
jgi:hypothetical protein